VLMHFRSHSANNMVQVRPLKMRLLLDFLGCSVLGLHLLLLALQLLEEAFSFGQGLLEVLGVDFGTVRLLRVHLLV